MIHARKRDEITIQDDATIIIRSVYGKVGAKFYIQPQKNPKTGRYSENVREVDSLGNAILKKGDEDPDKRIIKVTDVFILEDGKTYKLSDPHEKAEWEAIKHSPIIALARDEADATGNNLLIDGNASRYGVGVLYVEVPDIESARKVTKRELIHKAETYIFNDAAGADGRRKMAKILGKLSTTNAPDADIKEYLLDTAARNPEQIINLYTGSDLNMRILFIDAREKGTIYSRNNIYYFGDSTILGASNDAVISYLCDPRNSKIVDFIKKEVYPELYTVDNPNIKGKDKQ